MKSIEMFIFLADSTEHDRQEIIRIVDNIDRLVSYFEKNIDYTIYHITDNYVISIDRLSLCDLIIDTQSKSDTVQSFRILANKMHKNILQADDIFTFINLKEKFESIFCGGKEDETI